ncbi:ATP-dependent RNA helicase DeaD [Mesoflavibacter sabulilitoris]|uniref:ATP-dependent RNA helicase n=1 Tax=Mesoflavibacter zeaxanthinifaciens subsp. sabulilitoris TaxID=1520893 RepID=A0A2T1NKJ4_9FLAO|nr:DEAD/DEAH box helicase [Mesoflavibacter zeaxanthinifaciens]MBB3122623.1 ATP-dependent RNA helicase DeaD [Mesoflavibacter zeaxanthinifaciens subsp. sabulilitoris]PSG93424.1 ATP-dependent RNA helicase [Mesoflavibacter zeaxanthinifaciens subsp. sabulilitoris]
MSTFQQLGLDANLLQAITDLGFETPSEVQQKAIPTLLESERDLVALAQTGTGKTAAFGFPMLQKIDVNSRTTQGLILSPTRELCLQITNEMKLYGKYLNGLNVTAIYGGSSITEQARQVKRGAQIIVATPGRMKDMISRNLVDITKIQYAVLDEADEMLNMGFYDDINDILKDTPVDKSTWLFSATMPKEVARIAKDFMSNPLEVTVGNKNESTSNVSHEYYLVNSRDRYLALKRLADANPDIFSVIFCRTKRDTQKVAEKLIEDGYNAGALHGDLSQNQRDLVMKAFRNNQIQMLVATDVAARGIDVDDVTHVINYQLPDEIETYTHRSGRTGRAGKTGVSMVIVSKSEVRKIKSIERIIKREFDKKELPDGMEICEVQLMSLANKVHNTEMNHEIDAYLPSINEIFEDTSKEELIKKFFSVEFSRFFNYYKNSKNLNVEASSQDSSRSSSGDSTRFFINVGRKDGYDWMKLKDYLRDTLQLGRDDVFKVDVKDSFSFFNTEKEHQEKVLAFFTDFKENGRFINVEITEDRGGRDRKRGGGRRRDGGNDRRRRSDKPKGERRSRRSEDSNSSNKKSKRSNRDKSEFKSTHGRPRRSRR